METVRIGILGAARIVPSALIKPAQRVAEVMVAGIAARDIARAQAFAQKHNIPQVFVSYDELLADPSINAVYIPLPNSLHEPWILKALAAGKQRNMWQDRQPTHISFAPLLRRSPRERLCRLIPLRQLPICG